MELCVPDRDFSAPFKVEWLKVVHMPFKVFDREGMIIYSFVVFSPFVIDIDNDNDLDNDLDND